MLPLEMPSRFGPQTKPRRNHVIITFSIIGVFALMLLAYSHLTNSFHDARPGKLTRWKKSTTGSLWSTETAAGTRYTGMMFKPCVDTLTFGYAWFTTTFNLVCAGKDQSHLCNVKVNTDSTSGNYNSLDVWKHFRQAPDDAEEIIVKLGEETLIQKPVLDQLIDEFAANKPCDLTSVLIVDLGGAFWWPQGQLYMFKKRALPPLESDLWTKAAQYSDHDVQLGYLLQVPHDRVCRLDATKFAHTTFNEHDPAWDKRVRINFKDVSSRCEH